MKFNFDRSFGEILTFGRPLTEAERIGWDNNDREVINNILPDFFITPERNPEWFEND